VGGQGRGEGGPNYPIIWDTVGKPCGAGDIENHHSVLK